MKSKRLFAFLLSVICFCSTFVCYSGTASAQTEASHVTALNGSFIQPWLYMTYDDEQWNLEMQTLKEVGIDTLIMGDVANKSADGTWTTFYDSELDFLAGTTAYNALDKLLYYCDAYDIKLYLGMGLDTAWNSDITTSEGREANRQYMNNCNQITTELYQKYKAQYPDTYYGFYFVTELYNTIYMDTDLGMELYSDGLQEMFTMVIDNCNTLNPEMPILFSPYVNIFGYGYASINTDRFTEFWTKTLQKIPFRDGDCLCPQDSCGGGGNDVTHLEEWMAAYRDAVDRSNELRGTKLLLGTNAELFVSPDASRMSNPHGVSYVGTKTVDDFAKRLEICAPYCDTLFCFAYSHHYSPYNEIPAFHEAFVHYLQTGEIEKNVPTPPTTVQTSLVEADGGTHLKLTLSGMTDDTAVQQINIYQNGKLYDYMVPGVNNGQTGLNVTPTEWIDFDFDVSNGNATYEFEAVDVCGNVSPRSSFSVTASEIGTVPDAPNTGDALEIEKDALWYLDYTVTDSGVRINGCDKSAVHVEIPDTIAGVPVTVIDWYAFANCQNLVSVTIPDTVTHISRFAFVHCINLETVLFPASLYAIEQYAFQDCPKLQGIQLPNLSIIEERAFSGCDSITNLIIPESCQSIGAYAFFDCDSLQTATVSGETTLGTRSLGITYDSGYTTQKGFVLRTDADTGISYAQENGIVRVSGTMGDVNADGTFSIADAVMLQRWLLQEETTLADWQAGDWNADSALDAFDLCILKQKLLIS